MAIAETTNAVGMALAAAIGLDAEDIESIDLHLAAGHIATITARIFVRDELGAVLADQFRTITWVPKEP